MLISSSRDVYVWVGVLLCPVSAAVLHWRLKTLRNKNTRADISLKLRGERNLTVISVFIITLILTTSPTPLVGLQRQTTTEHPWCFIVDNQSLTSIYKFEPKILESAIQKICHSFFLFFKFSSCVIWYTFSYCFLSLKIASWQQILCCDHFWSGFSKRQRDQLKGQMHLSGSREFFFHFLRTWLCL